MYFTRGYEWAEDPPATAQPPGRRFRTVEKLHILITNNWRYTTGGLEVWEQRLGRALIESGHQVTFCVKRGSKLHEELQTGGFHVHAFPMRGDMDPRTVLPMARLIRKEGIDVVLSMRERDFRLVGLAAKLAGRGRVIARLRAVCGHDRAQWRRDFQFVRQRWRYRYFASRVVTNSEMGKRDLVEGGWLPDEKVEVIHNGVDLRAFDPERVSRGILRQEYGIPADALVAVLIGRIGERKGQVILVKAAEEILRRQPSAFFLLVGVPSDQAYYAEMAKYLEQSPFRERILFTGLRHDIPQVLADADVLAHPSEWEGLPNVVLEAMAMGRPVIATNAGGTAEVVEDGVNGFLLPLPVPVGLLVEKLEFLFTHPEERRRMGLAGRARVEKEFDMPQSVQRYETLFYKVLTES